MLLFFALFLGLNVAFDNVSNVGKLFSDFGDSFRAARYTWSDGDPAADGVTVIRLGDFETEWDNLPGKVINPFINYK